MCRPFFFAVTTIPRDFPAYRVETYNLHASKKHTIVARSGYTLIKSALLYPREFIPENFFIYTLVISALL